MLSDLVRSDQDTPRTLFNTKVWLALGCLGAIVDDKFESSGHKIDQDETQVSLPHQNPRSRLPSSRPCSFIYVQKIAAFERHSTHLEVFAIIRFTFHPSN